MKYLASQPRLAEALLHLRNKNLAVFPQERRLADKLYDRLSALLARWRAGSLAKRGFKLVVSEQIVENPMVFRYLRPEGRRLLDFGAFESVLPLQLSAIGYQVTVLDQRTYPFAHPNLTVLCHDLFGRELQSVEKFDTVLSVSTIEHLGLGTYGDIVQADADKQGIAILWSLVREGGRLMVSLPAGKPTVQRGYRTYNEARLRAVFPPITALHWFRKEGREGVWREVSADEVADLSYHEPHGQMPVEAVAFVVCDKV